MTLYEHPARKHHRVLSLYGRVPKIHAGKDQYQQQDTYLAGRKDFTRQHQVYGSDASQSNARANMAKARKYRILRKKAILAIKLHKRQAYSSETTAGSNSSLFQITDFGRQ